jgi:hypothetical protein
MDHPQTPRILAPHLSSFQHRIVRILGKVVQLRGESAIIDAGGHVDVILNRVHTPSFFHSSGALGSFLRSAAPQKMRAIACDTKRRVKKQSNEMKSCALRMERC